MILGLLRHGLVDVYERRTEHDHESRLLSRGEAEAAILAEENSRDPPVEEMPVELYEVFATGAGNEAYRRAAIERDGRDPFIP